VPFDTAGKRHLKAYGVIKIIATAIRYHQLASRLHSMIYLGENIFIGVITAPTFAKGDTGFFIQVVDGIMQHNDIEFLIVHFHQIILEGKGAGAQRAGRVEAPI
jgi:hypothetical protein